jgi:hypothetical protein
LAELKTLLNKAKRTVRESGGLAPMLFVFGKQEDFAAFVQMPKTAEERRALFYHIGRELGAKVKPRRAVLLVEAYCLKPKDGIIPPGSMADNPDAEECLMASEQTADGKSRGLMCTFERIPRLSGTRYEFGQDEVLQTDAGQNFLLEAFFAGAKAGQRG